MAFVVFHITASSSTYGSTDTAKNKSDFVAANRPAYRTAFIYNRSAKQTANISAYRSTHRTALLTFSSTY